MGHALDKGKFHIHTDARVMPDDLRVMLVELFGFTPTNFSGHPPGYRHFEPNDHATVKPANYEEFDRIWHEVQTAVAESDFVGYVEGEYIRSDVALPDRPYRRAPHGQRITRRLLTPDEGFRQAEVHLSLDKDRSDPQLIADLLEAGFYGAYLPKDGCTDLILTAQGRRIEIAEVIGYLQPYLERVGGTVGATLMEERIVKYYLQGVTQSDLPEVISRLG